MNPATKIGLGCGAFLAGGAFHTSLLAGELPPTSWIEFRLCDVAFTPAASTEELHAPEGMSVLPLLNDYEAFVVRLLLTKGHLRAGVEDYRAGNVKHALAHLGEPVDVLHSKLDRWLGTPGAERFDAALRTLVATVRAQNSIEVANQNLATALDALDGAVEKEDVDIRRSPRFVILVILSVVRAAVDEYELGVSGGEIVDLVEYQDARAFTYEARTYADVASAVLAARDAGAYGILKAELAALDMALPPAAQFHGKSSMSQDFRRAVFRLGLLYDNFK